MEIYLDNAATTRCLPEVLETMDRVMARDYGNPSSLHKKGVDAERYVREATETIARTLRCREKELIFTSGGTESNNLAILGTALANKRSGKHILTTAIEHDSVANTVNFLNEQGFETDFLSVDANGVLSLEELQEKLRPDTILVSVMMVNNEMGALEPVAAAGERIRRASPGAVFHVDAVQAYGKFPIYPGQMQIDLLSVSGHKIQGPKGVGFLYVREKTKIRPVMFGGGHQRGMRSGTINVPGIAGMGIAAKAACERLEEESERLWQLKAYFTDRLLRMEQVTVHGKTGRDSAPHIVSAAFAGVKSEVLLHALEERGIYVSSGSACSSNHRSESRTLNAMGVPAALRDCTLRFSFGADTGRDEIDAVCRALDELVPLLRRYTRR